MIGIKFWREDINAKVPHIAYNGTSACFDLFATKEVVVPAKGFAYVPNGIRLIVPDGYYLRFCTRSSLGFIKHLMVYGGVLDASFTGNLDVKIYNFGDTDHTIKAGDKYAQVEVLKRIDYHLDEIGEQEFLKLEKEHENSGARGSKGCWGSSNDI